MNPQVTYGDVQSSDPVETVGDETVPVFNGPDYLYSRRTLHFRFLYHPASTAWQGGSPAESKRDLESRLMKPRQQFILSFPGAGGDDIEVMRVPAAGFTVDAANGPIPLGVNVVKVYGARAFHVEWAVQLHVNESSRFGGAASVLLSHRYRQESTLDTNYFETRTIQGRAIFRTDRLAQLNVAPDDYRAWLWPSVPLGFKLEDAYVVADEDGTAVDYVAVLRQQFLNIQIANVTNIRAVHTSGMIGPGLEDYAFNMAEAGLDWASAGAAQVDRLGRAGSEIVDGLKGADPGKFISAGAQATGAAIDAARNHLHLVNAWRRNVPRSVNNFSIDVWGSPLATRKQLTEVAFTIMNGRLSEMQQKFGSNRSVMVSHDLMQPHVHLEASFTAGAVQSVAGLVANNAAAVPYFNFPDADDIIGVASKNPVQVNQPPNQHGTRGTYLGRLMAQALQGAFDTPAAVSTPANARSLQPPNAQGF